LRTPVRNRAHRLGGVLEGQHPADVRAQSALADPCHDGLGCAPRVVRKAFFPGTDEDADNRIVLEQGRFMASDGTSPLVNPIGISRPFQRMSRARVANSVPPILSTQTSRPSPPVRAFTRSRTSSRE